MTPTGTIKGNTWDFTTSNEETLITERVQKRLLVHANPTNDQMTTSGHQPNAQCTLTDVKGAIISKTGERKALRAVGRAASYFSISRRT